MYALSLNKLSSDIHHFYEQKVFVEKILNENHGLPCFCYGHSTGAAIILKVGLA